MVRSYLRHEPTQAFGVICSNTARSILDADGKTAYVPAMEDVLVWDIRKGEQVSRPARYEVKKRMSASRSGRLRRSRRNGCGRLPRLQGTR